MEILPFLPDNIIVIALAAARPGQFLTPVRP